MYQWILPTRYLWKRRITLLAITAVALCVFIVVVVMTVMNGLVEEFRGKNHRFVGDCVVSTESLVGFAYADEFWPCSTGRTISKPHRWSSAVLVC
jgi:ABC-type lipoprotein release transport system permease subunit